MLSKRVVFFGTLGIFSHSVLSRLIKQNVNVVAVIVAGAEPFKSPFQSLASIPVLNQPDHETIELLAIKHNISLKHVHDITSANTATMLRAYHPDFILIACFPHRLPQTVYSIPRLACLNIHPSMLPAYRGPTPVFWQLKNGENHMGVTIHAVSDKIDAGNIVIQQEQSLKDGMRGRAIDTQLGETGARLFIETLNQIDNKTVVPKIQDSALASYFSFPGVRDFTLSTQWSSRRAFNFMRGTDDWQQPYKVVIDDKDFVLTSAIAFSPAGVMEGNYSIEDDVITLRFAQGLLKAAL